LLRNTGDTTASGQSEQAAASDTFPCRTQHRFLTRFDGLSLAFRKNYGIREI
jgi:hypothetical protein